MGKTKGAAKAPPKKPDQKKKATQQPKARKAS